MRNHTTYTTVRAGDKYAYEKANKDAGWEQNPRQGTKSKKKWTTGSSGKSLLETQAVAFSHPPPLKGYAYFNLIRYSKLKFYRVQIHSFFLAGVFL